MPDVETIVEKDTKTVQNLNPKIPKTRRAKTSSKHEPQKTPAKNTHKIIPGKSIS